MDPTGWALVGGSSPRKYFSEYVTYTARIDPVFNGTFTLTFNAAIRYTHKSQYLLNAILLGNKGTGLTANQQANRLTGNSANNVLTGKGGNDILDGGAGNDTAVFSGVSSQYTIVEFGNTVTVTDKINNRDGIDTLTNINLLIFSDTSLTP